MSTVPQYPPAPQPVPQPKNGLGTAGFVLGLVGLLFSFIPVIGLIAWPLVILGLIFSIIGLLRANKGEATNKGLSIAGIAVSAIGLVVCVLWVAVFGKVASEVSDNRLQFGKDVAGGHSVEFVITGNQPVNVTYGDIIDTKQEIVQPGAEWRQKAGYQGGPHLFSLTATTTQATGDSKVSCSILVDGKKVAEQQDSLGAAMCTATVN
ncbi:DUF4190 domain-containing protein [Amycolatopsis anabasis]|uniref:DUF4190 domain-containing protein n=1 Tax=Amycolatopsis anabasis TaxID=1840409 RepID=UPI00131E63C2|nr:DUF4190 domain-containing protein [Amycolatopsis anabasis]